MHFRKIHRSQKINRQSTRGREKKGFATKKGNPRKGLYLGLGSYVQGGIYDMTGYMVSESALQPASAEVCIVAAAPRCRHTTVVVAMACALALAAITWYVCRKVLSRLVMRQLLTLQCN
jgi:hypothetical protein